MLQTRYEEFDRLQEQKLLMELTGVKSQEEIYAIISGDMTNFIEYMDNNLDKFFDNQIEAFSNFNTTFSDFLDTYRDNLQELYDIKIKDVEIISADDWLDKNDEFLDTAPREYTGDLTLGQKRPFIWNPQDLYEVVENESKLMKNSPEAQKYIDTMTGEFLDYSAIARDLLGKGDLYGATQALWERNEKMAHNQETYGNVQTNTEFLKKMLEERVIDKAQYDELVKAVSDQTPATTKMVETAVNNINYAAAQRAYQQGLSDYEEIQIESASMQFVEALATNMPRITEQGVNQLIDLTLQTGILGTGINDNIGVVDGTIHSEAEALLNGINKSRDALVDLLTSINKNLTEEEAQQIIDQAYGDATSGGGGSSPNVIKVDSSGNAPANTPVGTLVQTAGGTYQVVSANTPRASYNPVNGLYSVKVSDSPTYTSSSSGNSGGNSRGTSTTSDTIKVGSSGNAPANTPVGTIVQTAGGNYQVVSAGTPRASYNPASGLYSIKVEGHADGIEGGPVTYTGLTMLHGTPTAPEYVLNSDQAYTLLHNIATLRMPEYESKLVKQDNGIQYVIQGDIILENCDDPAKFWNEVTKQMSNRWNVTKNR